jgi:hypothetical protein
MWQVSGYASAILHPLIRVLDGALPELRKDALDTICTLLVALGPDSAIFVPTIRKVGTQAHHEGGRHLGTLIHSDC